MPGIVKLRSQSRTRFVRTALAVAALALMPWSGAHAQQNGTDATYMYRGADRDQRLLEKARAEGSVTWFTSINPTESRQLIGVFEKKYGVKVELWRAPSEKLIQRITTEVKANRHTFDVVETNASEVEILASNGLTAEFHSPYIADLPQHGIPKHRLWMPDRVNFFVVAYNTNKVKREELPKTLEGFLDPKWKGRIALESEDWDWMDEVILHMGPEKGRRFFEKFAASKPELRKGHPLLAQLITAGEVDVSPTVFLANALSGKQRGGPIDWAPIEPVIGLPFAVGVAKRAPHPHAALLLTDFLLSPEGQEILNKLGRLPASNKVKDNIVNFDYKMMDVGLMLEKAEAREKAWKSLFVQGN